MRWEDLNLENYYKEIDRLIHLHGQWSSDIKESENGCSRHHIRCHSFGGLPEKLDWSEHENIIWVTHYEHLMLHKILAYDNPDDHLACSGYIIIRNNCEKYDIDIDSIEDVEMFNKIYHTAQARPGELNGMFGKTHSAESIANILENRSYEKYHSDEFRNKRREISEDSKWYTNGIDESFTRTPQQGWYEGRKPGTNCGGKNAAAIKCYVYDENKQLLDICECINYAGLRYGLKDREAKGHTGWEKGPYKGYYFIKESEVM